MRLRSTVLAGVLATADTFAVAPTPAGADTVNVAPGGSIQAALDAAPSGAHVHVAPGRYTENLEITKPVTLDAEGVILVPPATHRMTPCDEGAAYPGICVHGQIDQSGNPTAYLDRVTIEGISVRSFSGSGVFAIGVSDFRVRDARFSRNGGYGIFSLHSRSVEYHDSFAYFNGEAGFYVGESPNADVEIEGNHTYKSTAEGILFRDSEGGTISDNIVDGNCAGIFLLDTGAPGTGGDVTVEDNRFTANQPDVFWDGSGSGNRFDDNRCTTSTPGSLCS
jgi:parallel beta-helix repeat protein